MKRITLYVSRIMKPFHTIAVPHRDILKGRLTMNVFAADLWEVFKGRGAEDGGISEQEYELVIEETLQQLGIELEE